ncbi:hypothetical protein E4T39_06212 [Aureobasidium subglaciale]|nr:hypothetical protein E4T39_06212 [Aureobasidium subglaciale]
MAQHQRDRDSFHCVSDRSLSSWLTDGGGGIRVAGFTADGPDGCISKSLPTPGTGILRSGLEGAASVSMAWCKNDLVVATWKAQRSIQHCRGDATIQTTRLLHFPLTTRCAPTMQPLSPPESRRDPAYLANLLEYHKTEWTPASGFVNTFHSLPS